MVKGKGKYTPIVDRSLTLKNEDPESATSESDITKLKPKPRYINSQQFRSQTDRFNPLKGFSAEEGRRTRKAKTITNLHANIPWNNFSHSPSGCPASMACVLYGKRTFNLNYPQSSSFISTHLLLENCGADGFVKTGIKGRIFHSGGRGMLRVGI